MNHTNFQIVLKILLSVVVEIVDLALRAVIESFEIYTIHFLLKKIKTNFIMFIPSIWVAKLKQNTIFIE